MITRLLKKLHVKTSIKTKGIVYVVVLIWSIYFSVSILVLSSAKKNLHDQIEKFHKSIADRLAMDAADAFISRDYEVLVERILQLKKAGQIKGTTVVDLRGIVVSSDDIKDIGRTSTRHLELLEAYRKGLPVNNTEQKVLVPIEVEGDLFGIMEVEFDWEKERSTLDRQFSQTKRQLFYLALIITALGIAGAFVVSSLLTKPIIDLTKKIEDFERELLPVHKWEINPNVKDETVYLREAFKHMIESLKRYLREYRRVSEERQRLSCLATVGEISAQIAHEIRNSLHAIKGAISGIEDSGPDESIREYIDIIKEETSEMSETMEEFLRFSKMPSPVLKLSRIDRVVDRVIELIESDLEDSGIKIQKSYLTEIPATMIDPALLKQVFMNLFMNSIQAMPMGGEIRITYRASDQWVEVVFSDTGPGVPEELKDKVFQPFFTTKPEGAGLGLATVYKIILAHHGQISLVDSKRGASFVIRLPVSETQLSVFKGIGQ